MGHDALYALNLRQAVETAYSQTVDSEYTTDLISSRGLARFLDFHDLYRE
jgi:hypothetical protein